jgi:hypothetical protein
VTEINDVNEEMDGTLDSFAKETARPLRGPVHITEGFHARTMAAIRREASSPAESLFASRMIRVSPLGAFALAALLIAVAFGSAAIGRSTALKSGAVASAGIASTSTVIAADTVHIVRFQLAAPGAHRVTLVGDFNDWSRDAITLQPAEQPGVWTASVPLSAGRHEYAFIVDDQKWVADPYAMTHRDEYDVESSVIRVGESGS